MTAVPIETAAVKARQHGGRAAGYQPREPSSGYSVGRMWLGGERGRGPNDGRPMRGALAWLTA